MNILFPSNTSGEYIELVDLNRFDDKSGYGAVLRVQSRNFNAEIPFYFERACFEEFCQAVLALEKTHVGKAVLKPFYDPEFISIEMQKNGHLLVSGELFEHSEIPQHLKFQFVSDQSQLKRLIEDLANV